MTDFFTLEIAELDPSLVCHHQISDDTLGSKCYQVPWKRNRPSFIMLTNWNSTSME